MNVCKHCWCGVEDAKQLTAGSSLLRCMSRCTEELECKGIEFFQGTTTYCMQCMDPTNTIIYIPGAIPKDNITKMEMDKISLARPDLRNGNTWASSVYKKGM